MVSSAILLTTMLAFTGITARPMPHGHPHVAVRLEHFEVLHMRASTAVNPAAVVNTQCLNSKVYDYSP